MKVTIQTKFKETNIGPIPAEWDLKPLRDLTTKIGSGATPRGGNDAYIDNGPYTLIRSQNIYDDRFEYNGLAHINDEQAAELSNVEVKEADVLLNITGASLGRANIVPKNILPARVNQHVAILRSNGELDPHFLKGWLHLPQVKSYILGHNAGGTREAITKEMIENFVLPVPPLSEQKQIAEILSSVDDKIEVNRAINANLEKLASAIFKKWFVDMGDELPKGWKKVSILEFADLLSGGTPKTEISEYWDGNFPWVSAKDVTMAQNSFILTTERQITQAGIDNSATHILPALTTVITARGTVGNYCLLGRDMAMNQTNYGLRAKDNKSHYFVFFSIAHLVEELRQRAYGTIFDTITTHTFQHTEIVQPSDLQIELFEAITGSIMAKVLANLRESETLKVVRDSLLPRLMSGKIRV